MASECRGETKAAVEVREEEKCFYKRQWSHNETYMYVSKVEWRAALFRYSRC